MATTNPSSNVPTADQLKLHELETLDKELQQLAAGRKVYKQAVQGSSPSVFFLADANDVRSRVKKGLDDLKKQPK